MKCAECVHARRFSGDGIYCVMYGMITRTKNECNRKGARRREGDEDRGGPLRGEGEGQAGDGRGDPGAVPEVL